mgnify:CR=1 FL=1
MPVMYDTPQARKFYERPLRALIGGVIEAVTVLSDGPMVAVT